jgi:hypothetical protein
MEVKESGFWVLFAVAVLSYLGFAAPMTVLVVYHVFFQVNGISTYAYIMENFKEFPQRLRKFTCGAPQRIGNAPQVGLP